jgi:hypothetical protein
MEELKSWDFRDGMNRFLGHYRADNAAAIPRIRTLHEESGSEALKDDGAEGSRTGVLKIKLKIKRETKT